MTARWIAAAVAVASLSACDSGSNQRLQAWMVQEQGKIQPKVASIAPPKTYSPEAYLQQRALEPFSAQRMALAFGHNANRSDAGSKLIAAELARRKEPLEEIPLDAMVMVGILNRAGNPIALIRIDKLIYQVEKGQHLGQNHGRITRVGESEVALREVVQDASGEWVERLAKLQLQERAK